jgi:hypothetical protein
MDTAFGGTSFNDGDTDVMSISSEQVRSDMAVTPRLPDSSNLTRQQLTYQPGRRSWSLFGIGHCSTAYAVCLLVLCFATRGTAEIAKVWCWLVESTVQKHPACLDTVRQIATSRLQILGQRSFFNNTDLPTGFLFSPLSTPLGEIPHCALPPPQCITCGAFANKFCEYDRASTAWICNFCGSGCVHSEGLPSDAPFKLCEDFDYLPAATEAALSSEQCWPALVSFVIDATLDEDLLEEVVEACKVLLQRLPGSTLVSLVAFDSAVTIFDLAPPNQLEEPAGPAQSWVLPGDAAATPAMLQRLCASAAGLIAPVDACMHTACAALDTLRPLHNTLKPRARPRCIGAALAGTHGVYGEAPFSCSVLSISTLALWPIPVRVHILGLQLCDCFCLLTELESKGSARAQT